jgi:hypothetical protein
MERWGGVKSFELILRRREQLRVDAEPPAESKERSARARSSGSGIRKETRSSRALTAPQRSRKHPTAINAPVPSWLRELVGKLKSFEDVRELIEHVRAYLSDLRKEEREEQLTLSMSPTPSLAVSPRHAAGNDRKRLVKSTASAFKNNQRLQNSRVRFPDVEILPTFKPWVVEAALRQRSSGKREVNEESQPSDIPDNERIVDLDGSPETSDTRDGSAHAHTAEDLPDAPANAESEQVRRTQQTQQTEDLSQSQIGRAGTNSGASESQRRRSLRVYLDSLNQVSGKGSVQKPREKKR